MVSLVPATAQNWEAIARVRPAEGQRRWVADVAYYLCLSKYEGFWRSYAVLDDRATVGHVMWAVDPDESSHWFGGLVIDEARQGQGLGRATVTALLALWEEGEPGLSGTAYPQAALSVSPRVARRTSPSWSPAITRRKGSPSFTGDLRLYVRV